MCVDGEEDERMRDLHSFAISANTVLTCLTQVRVMRRPRLPCSPCLLNRWAVKAVISLSDLVVNVDKDLCMSEGVVLFHVLT